MTCDLQKKPAGKRDTFRYDDIIVSDCVRNIYVNLVVFIRRDSRFQNVYLHDNKNLSCICNNPVLSGEELFYGSEFTMFCFGLH